VPGVARHLHEHEGELPDLRQPDPHQERGGQRMAEHPHHRGADHRLAHDHHEHQPHQQRHMAQYRAQVDEGAHGHEEEGPEGVAQRQQAREGLVRVVRLADDEAGQERAQREGQSDRLGQRRRAQRDGEGHEQEQLRAPHAGDVGHQRRDHARHEIEERQEDEGRLAQGQRDGEEAAGAELAQRRQQHHQGDRDEILDDREAHHDATVPRVELPPVEEQARQHHGARDRDHHPDDEPGQSAPSYEAARRHAHAHAEENAEGAAEEGHPLHAEEVPHRELDADREHEEHDADLGEEIEGMRVRDRGAWGERADEQPADHVAEDERLAQRPGRGAADHRSEKDEREVGEHAGIGDHGRNLARGHAALGRVLPLAADWVRPVRRRDGRSTPIREGIQG
jgi:hypothetical protein